MQGHPAVQVVLPECRQLGGGKAENRASQGSQQGLIVKRVIQHPEEIHRVPHFRQAIKTAVRIRIGGDARLPKHPCHGRGPAHPPPQEHRDVPELDQAGVAAFIRNGLPAQRENALGDEPRLIVKGALHHIGNAFFLRLVLRCGRISLRFPRAFGLASVNEPQFHRFPAH